MPKYALLRDMDPSRTRTDLDGAALNTLAALQSYIFHGGDAPKDEDHGIRWIRTYWEPGGSWGLCLYEAPNLEILTDFETTCDRPFVEGYEVEEITAPTTAEDTSSLGGGRIAVSLNVRGADSPDAVVDACTELGEPRPDGQWVRTYWDPAGGRATTLFAVDDSEDWPERSGDTRNESLIAQVVEIYPSEYR